MEHFPQPSVDPPDPPMECSRCDGDTFVANEDYYPENKAMECPHCDGTGEEPAPDPLDDPRL